MQKKTYVLRLSVQRQNAHSQNTESLKNTVGNFQIPAYSMPRGETSKNFKLPPTVRQEKRKEKIKKKQFDSPSPIAKLGVPYEIRN